MIREIKIKRILSFILLLSLIISMIGCTNNGNTQGNANTDGNNQGSDTVKIGLIYPLTGPAAKTGKEYVAAYELARDIINEKYDLDLPFAETEGLPNLNGAKIEFVVADHKGQPELGLSETERLITQEKVVAVMGAHYSSVTKTASNAAERLQIPFLCPDSTSKALTERGFKWFFRTGPHDGVFVTDTYKFMDELNDNNNAGIKTIAIVTEDTEFGMLLAKEQVEQAADYGYEIVENITYPANSTNLTSEVIKLKEANPDVVVMASYTSDAILFLKTFKEQNFAPKAIIGQRAGFIAPELFEALGSTADYIYTTNVWALDLAKANPVIEEVNNLFKERTGVDLTGDYARAFTGLFAMADAINRAGSTDPQALQTALLETDIKNDGGLIVPWEGIKFDQETHQNIYSSGIITQAIDGSYQTVYPIANKAAEAIYPMPEWNLR
jgi:branched-chain amino acid transport system substrate-binding protein